jgi:hypothetical protein
MAISAMICCRSIIRLVTKRNSWMVKAERQRVASGGWQVLITGPSLRYNFGKSWLKLRRTTAVNFALGMRFQSLVRKLH